MGKFDAFFVAPEIDKKVDLADMIKSYWKDCNCVGCPTYTSCASDKGERVYCLAGKSPSCIKESDMSGCICPGCPVQAELDLEKIYYCIYGSAKEQR